MFLLKHNRIKSRKKLDLFVYLFDIHAQDDLFYHVIVLFLNSNQLQYWNVVVAFLRGRKIMNK
jgi:hypothetical protein